MDFVTLCSGERGVVTGLGEVSRNGLETKSDDDYVIVLPKSLKYAALIIYIVTLLLL